MNFRLQTQPPASQRGASLIFALCALVVLTLGGVALVRTVDTGTLALGNLGFKRDTISASSVAAEKAIDWLLANSKFLNQDIGAQGYYASATLNLAPTLDAVPAGSAAILVDWKADSCGGWANCVTPGQSITIDGSTTASYVITRLCPSVGPVSQCAQSLRAPAGTSTGKGALSQYIGEPERLSAPLGAGTAYYRIVVRAEGTRGSVAFTETIVNL